MDDEADMLRVKQGEVGQLDALFRRHARPLFGFFYGVCQDPAASEDLVQEVFWRILRYRETFDARRRFRPWLFRIARNLLADRLRQVQRTPEVELDHLPEPADATSPNAYQNCARHDEHDRLRNALAALPSEQREILILARFEGLTFAEIGEIVGCSEGTAKVRAFRALRALRTTYQQLERKGHA